jgi:outer membrane lipoprotein-sorting protein
MIAELGLISVLTSMISEDIDDYVQKSLKDATFVAKKVKAVQKELKLINDDFGLSYRFDKVQFQYKEPLKLRLEASVEETSAIYIIDGPTQMIRVPRLRQNVKQDLSRSPGRRQTPLDFGILTPGLFRDLFQGKFVRQDRASGNAVFDLTYRGTDDTSRHRIWIDQEKGITTKREWYNQHGRQLATFVYENPSKISGVWVPTMVSVKNVNNVVAGVTRYESVKVNTGIPDSLFSFN